MAYNNLNSPSLLLWQRWRSIALPFSGHDNGRNPFRSHFRGLALGLPIRQCRAGGHGVFVGDCLAHHDLLIGDILYGHVRSQRQGSIIGLTHFFSNFRKYVMQHPEVAKIPKIEPTLAIELKFHMRSEGEQLYYEISYQELCQERFSS